MIKGHSLISKMRKKRKTSKEGTKIITGFKNHDKILALKLATKVPSVEMEQPQWVEMEDRD